MKQCKNCGEQLKGDWVLCPHCGGELIEIDNGIDATEELTMRVPAGDRAPELGIPRGVEIYLEIIDGPAKGVKYEVKKGRMVVGRKESDLVINDPKISRKHFSLEIWSRDIAYIQDLASTNGTYLNGAKITKTRIKDGDIVSIGDTRIKFLIKATG